MNRIMAAFAVGLLSLSAGCSTPAEQAIGNAVIGGLAGAGMGGASLGRPGDAAGDGAAPSDAATHGTSAGGPDYGAKKPHDHCGNGTMVHLGSVICSP